MHECFSFRIQILGSRVHAEIIGKSTVVFGETKRKLSSMIEEEEFLQRTFLSSAWRRKWKCIFCDWHTPPSLKKVFLSLPSPTKYTQRHNCHLGIRIVGLPTQKKGRKFQTRSDKNQGTLPHLQKGYFFEFWGGRRGGGNAHVFCGNLLWVGENDIALTHGTSLSNRESWKVS